METDAKSVGFFMTILNGQGKKTHHIRREHGHSPIPG